MLTSWVHSMPEVHEPVDAAAMICFTVVTPPCTGEFTPETFEEVDDCLYGVLDGPHYVEHDEWVLSWFLFLVLHCCSFLLIEILGLVWVFVPLGVVRFFAWLLGLTIVIIPALLAQAATQLAEQAGLLLIIQV